MSRGGVVDYANAGYEQYEEDSEMSDQSKKQVPMRYCFCCGEELGRYADHDRYDTCGKLECDREVRSALAQERERAYRRRLDLGDY